MNLPRRVRIVSLLFITVALAGNSIPSVFAQTNKGISRFNAWEFQEAEKILRGAVKTNPQDNQAAYYLGLSVLMQDKHSEALDILLKAQESLNKTGFKPATVPDAYQMNIALARTYLELKQNEDAWKQLEAAGKLQADAVDVHVYRGAYYLNKENFPQAIQELEKAMNLDENNAYAHYYAGYAYLRSGNPSKAVEVFKSFLQLAPQAPEFVKVKALVDALC
jgi:tetratricopeptide (TPR) repeat protein